MEKEVADQIHEQTDDNSINYGKTRSDNNHGLHVLCTHP